MRLRDAAWYRRAVAASPPGRVVVGPPELDPGGAGYILSLSRTVPKYGILDLIDSIGTRHPLYQQALIFQSQVFIVLVSVPDPDT